MSEIKTYAVIQTIPCPIGQAANIIALRQRKEDAEKIRDVLTATSIDFDDYQVVDFIIP